MEEDSGIDSKIKQELECLNTTSKKINDLENDINEKRSQYRAALTNSTQRLNALARKLGDCVSKARPYYDAKRIAKHAHNEAQQAALQFERAVSMHTAAREMVTVAERGMVNDSHDTAWAEMLNHATTKVNEAESERHRIEFDHLKRADAFKTAEEKVKKLNRSLKSSIKKSQPYFEMKRVTHQTLDTITSSVHTVENDLKSLKYLYSTTLQSLEKISDTIHASRGVSELTEEQKGLLLGKRQEGVGAEDPFNDQEIISELKLTTSDSQLNVLSDLCKSDSVDQLSDLTNLDIVSFTSSTSQNSTASTSAEPEGSKLNLNTDKPGTSLQHVSETNSSESENEKCLSSNISPDTDTFKEDSVALDDANKLPTQTSASNDESTRNTSNVIEDSCNSVPSPNSSPSPSINHVDIKLYSPSEIVLSVAGLGEVPSFTK